MTPTLNQEDIKLLKGIFATKDDLKDFAKKDDLVSIKSEIGSVKKDLVSMESRFNKKFAAKDDLASMEKRFDKKFATKVEINDRFDQLETILAKTFVNVEGRIQTLEDEVGIFKTN